MINNPQLTSKTDKTFVKSYDISDSIIEVIPERVSEHL